ncbi:MAG: TonB-dependent siderophore receptor, partial [Burkholderiales bacterium]
MAIGKSRAAAAAACLAFTTGAAGQIKPEQRLPEVTVRPAPLPQSPYGPDEGYQAARSTTATKTDTPLLETPQAVTIVTRERIEDQGAQNLQDALNYAAGVRSDAYGLDSRSDNVRVRGAYPDEYRDGLRRMVGYYTSNTRTEPYTLERIEVLRGPSAMLYGQGTTGGIINMVSKRPLAEPMREIGVQIGSYNRKQIQADLTGPLDADGRWLYRLVALGRDADTQVDYVADDRKVFAPSLTWRPSAATSLTLQGLWQDDHSGSTSQFFPFKGVVLPNPNGRIPVRRFVGDPDKDRYDSERKEVGWLFEHRFSDRWTVRQNFRYARNAVDYRSIYADFFTNPSDPYIDPAQRVLNRTGYFEQRRNKVLTADQHLEGRVNTGPVQHHLLLGVDIVRFRERSKVALYTPPAIDVFDPVYLPYAEPALADNPRSKLHQAGIYLQDQMRIGNWIVVAGLRRDRAKN